MISFGRFPRLRYGEGCDGADITVDGKNVGWIEREVYWEEKYRALRGVKPVITGYTVILSGEDIDRTFDTLADARDFVRRRFA
jgi:hypothetical protein